MKSLLECLDQVKKHPENAVKLMQCITAMMTVYYADSEAEQFIPQSKLTIQQLKELTDIFLAQV